MFNIECSHYKNITKFEDTYKLDFSKVDKLLENERIKSLDYLKKSIDFAKQNS